MYYCGCTHILKYAHVLTQTHMYAGMTPDTDTAPMSFRAGALGASELSAEMKCLAVGHAQEVTSCLPLTSHAPPTGAAIHRASSTIGGVQVTLGFPGFFLAHPHPTAPLFIYRIYAPSSEAVPPPEPTSPLLLVPWLVGVSQPGSLLPNLWRKRPRAPFRRTL